MSHNQALALLIETNRQQEQRILELEAALKQIVGITFDALLVGATPVDTQSAPNTQNEPFSRDGEASES